MAEPENGLPRTGPRVYEPNVGMFRRPDDRERIGFFFDEEAVDARPGDTISTALIEAGLLMTSRSPKYRRPRGAFCLNGDCGTCLVRVDGRPNVRACTTVVERGMSVHPQNTYRPKGLDPTQLVDRVFASGFDHHHFMVKPRIANVAMQTVARELGGLGELPDRAWDRGTEHRHLEPTVLVLGCGPAGRAAADALAEAGVDFVAVERGPAQEGGEAGSVQRAHFDTAMFAAYPGESLWAGTGEVADKTILYTFRAKQVLLTLGSRDPLLPFPNNDVPGVVSARGLLRTLEQAEATLEAPVVVVGRGKLAEDCAVRLSAQRVDPEDVESVEGGARVEGLRLRGGKRIECRLVAVAATPAPASDLANQAGVKLRWDGSGYAVTRDKSGRCGRFDDAQLWAAGDVTGWMGPGASAADGARVGKQIGITVDRLKDRGGTDA